MGQRKVMLPIEFLKSMETYDNTFDIVKKNTIAHMREYRNILVSEKKDMLEYYPDIFESKGLGKMEIVSLKGDKAKVRIHCDSPEKCTFTQAVVTGMFSYILDKELESKMSVKRSFSEITLR